MYKERPLLSNLVNENTTETEKFQNEVLRPIIKMQNDLLIALLKAYLKKRKVDFNVLSEPNKKSIIKSIFQKNMNLKNLLLGIVLGNFSLDEFLFYEKKASEFNKRIIQIIIQRLQSKTSLIKL